MLWKKSIDKDSAIMYPLVSGLNNVEVLKKIQKILSFQSICNETIEEWRQDRKEGTGVFHLDYEVNYNKNYILDVVFTMQVMAAILPLTLYIKSLT